jgi:hypothetical protein
MKLIALAFMLAVTAQAQTITATADCTTSCKIVTDPVLTAIPGVDNCDIWRGGNKIATAKYVGGEYGCVWNVPIPDGETWWMVADVVRADWSGYSPASNMLILTSMKGWVSPSLLAPQNLRVSSCDSLQDLLLRDIEPHLYKYDT